MHRTRQRLFRALAASCFAWLCFARGDSSAPRQADEAVRAAVVGKSCWSERSAGDQARPGDNYWEVITRRQYPRPLAVADDIAAIVLLILPHFSGVRAEAARPAHPNSCKIAPASVGAPLRYEHPGASHAQAGPCALQRTLCCCLRCRARRLCGHDQQHRRRPRRQRHRDGDPECGRHVERGGRCHFGYGRGGATRDDYGGADAPQTPICTRAMPVMAHYNDGSSRICVGDFRGF